MKFILSIFILSLVLWPQFSLAQSGSQSSAQGQRIIISEDQPTIEQSIAKPNPYSINMRQILYLFSALILFGVAVIALLRLVVPTSGKELIEKNPDNLESPAKNNPNENKKL